MSDAYGKIQISISNQCELNITPFISELNKFEWDRGYGRWIERDGEISYSDECSQYPSVFPRHPMLLNVKNSQNDNSEQKYFTELRNGEFLELNNSEQDKYYDSPTCSLSFISNSLAKHMMSGWVEISCFATQKGNRYEQRLRVNSDGNTIRENRYYPLDEKPTHIKEEYTSTAL